MMINWREVLETDLGRKFLEVVQTGNVPTLAEWQSLGLSTDSPLRDSHDRSNFCLFYSWAVPCKEVVDELVGMGRIHEVMAGSGYWGRVLRANGATISCSDLKTKQYNLGEWMQVHSGNAANALYDSSKYDTVLMVWPPYKCDEDADAEALGYMRSGQRLVLVGEGEDGCTGSQALFDRLKAEFTLEKEMELPNWPCVHDYVSIYVKK